MVACLAMDDAAQVCELLYHAEAIGIPPQDIGPILRHAVTATDLYGPAALEDLDGPWRVGACVVGAEHRFSGRKIGVYNERTILVWPKR